MQVCCVPYLVDCDSVYFRVAHTLLVVAEEKKDDKAEETPAE